MIRETLRQYLVTDRFLGLDFVPISRPSVESQVRPKQRIGEESGEGQAAQGGKVGSLIQLCGGGGLVGFDGSVSREPTLSLEERVRRLRLLDESKVKGCRKCTLCETRTQTVFGQGDPATRVVFVGEAPGFEEDQQGLAFVGRAGQLLTKMIGAMGLTRDQVFICNVLKCRPPNNRTPTADEMLACGPYLREQLQIIQPEVLVALGAPASKTLLNTAEPIGRLRGRFHRFFFSGIADVGPFVPVMPTFHPAYLLRSPDEKGKAWEDLKTVMKFLGLALPPGRVG